MQSGCGRRELKRLSHGCVYSACRAPGGSAPKEHECKATPHRRRHKKIGRVGGLKTPCPKDRSRKAETPWRLGAEPEEPGPRSTRDGPKFLFLVEAVVPRRT